MGFRLVQRLEAAPDGIPKNVMAGAASLRVSKMLLDAGAQVDLAYMGSSEFESPKILVGSANRIAVVAETLKVVTRKLVRPTYSEDVHFVCTSDQAVRQLPEWDTWTQNTHSQESSGYFRDYGRVDEKVVGWWALSEDLIWTRNDEVAERIRGAFATIQEAAKD